MVSFLTFQIENIPVVPDTNLSSYGADNVDIKTVPKIAGQVFFFSSDHGLVRKAGFFLPGLMGVVMVNMSRV